MPKYSQKSIIGKVEKTIAENGLILPNEKIIVALSGGPDSMALLKILQILSSKFNFQVLAAHFNHHMRGEESNLDLKFLENFCQREGIELAASETALGVKLKSEDEAREHRYRFFEKILEEERGDKIAIAHQLNDFAETTLLRLVRGSGLSGARSIPLRRGKIIRPLLQITREEVMEFIKSEEIPYLTDQTNFDQNILRNKIRLETLPHLKSINPNILEALTNFSLTVNDDYDCLRCLALKKLEEISDKKTEKAVIIDRNEWLTLHPALARLTLRLAMEEICGLKNITLSQLEEVILMIKKGVGKKKKVLPHSLQIELLNGKIVLNNK